MLASEVPREQWDLFLARFNEAHSGASARVERHQPGHGIIFEVSNCVFQRIHDDCSGDHHRMGVVVGEPQQNQETFLMTDPQMLVWSQEQAVHTLQIFGTDGRCLVVRLVSKIQAAA